MNYTHCPLCGSWLNKTSYNPFIDILVCPGTSLHHRFLEFSHCKFEYSYDRLVFIRFITDKYLVYSYPAAQTIIRHIDSDIESDFSFLEIKFSSQEELNKKLELYLLFS
jgi:hypothetical protein